MSKSKDPEIERKYNSKDIPKIKNIFAFIYRATLKLLAIVVFGVGAVFLSVFVFPFIRLFSRNKNFGISARKYVSHTFRVFLNILHSLHGARYILDNPEFYKDIHSKIIVANHPSLLDFVYIMAMVPNSTCIVRGGLTKTPLGGVIKQAYITNTTDFDDLCKKCKLITDEGSNVIIFPEGTRTPRHGRNNYKKGAARIALFCNCDVQPILIAGSDKFGLGKHDNFVSYNHVEEYLFDIKALPQINISEYKSLSEPIAAKRLTEEMEKTILNAGLKYNENHPRCKTINNI